MMRSEVPMGTVGSKGSLLPALGGRSRYAQFCRAGTSTWYQGTIVDVTEKAMWVTTSAPHVPGAVYLCYFQVGDREFHLALRRTRDPLCFELLEGMRQTLGDLLAAPGVRTIAS